MSTPETKLKNAAKAHLETLGSRVWYFKVLGGPGQKAGVPDIVGCLDGKFFAAELKVKPFKPSEKQLYEIDNIRRAGGSADVIYDIAQFKKFLESAA